jgi:hypothetical protein
MCCCVAAAILDSAAFPMGLDNGFQSFICLFLAENPGNFMQQSNKIA